MERSMYFDSNALIVDDEGKMIPDRTYNAKEFTAFNKALISTGILKGSGNLLKVDTSGSNMVATVDTGIAFIEGRYYENDSLLPHTHDTESLGRNRIDRIVIRLDTRVEARWVRSFVKKGVASTAPIAPTLQRDENVHEISLAQIKIVGGQTFINKEDIADEREDVAVCGWAGSRILPNFDDVALSELVEKVNTGLVDATTTRKGIVKLNNTLTSTSSTEAATPNVIKQLNDSKANKAQEGQSAIVLQNGWINTGPATYYKDTLGRVHIHGWITGGTKTTNTVLFALPAGYKPLTSSAYGIPTNSTATDGRIVAAYFDNGKLILDGTALNNLYINISFGPIV